MARNGLTIGLHRVWFGNVGAKPEFLGLDPRAGRHGKPRDKGRCSGVTRLGHLSPSPAALQQHDAGAKTGTFASCLFW